ncbi:MAG: hypothetical protein HY363_01525 [Candidatus Aenigmarchaeota archaeon]|nr:hypothetical protein [Candidatus Aenigmarchaeota archaeon]
MKKYTILIIVILLSSYSSALGIRPAQTNAHFVPDATATYTFKIVNDEHIDMKVILSASGAIDDLLTFPQKEIEVKAEQEVVPVEFSLVFPKQMQPGDMTGSVVVTQTAGATKQLGGLTLDKETLEHLNAGGISARLQILHKVNLNVPIKGKYVVANLALRELEPEKIHVITDIKNEGFEKVQLLTSQVSVLNDNSTFEILPANSGSLDLQEKMRFDQSLEKTKFGQGEYTVMAEITYDNARIELSKKLLIGTPQISVVNSEIYIAAGKINKWAIDVENLWNGALEDQSFEAVLRKGDQEINRWKTLTFGLLAKEAKQITSYIDATSLETGDYDVELVSTTNVGLLNSKRTIKVVNEEDLPKTESSLVIFVGVLMVVVMMLLVAVLLMLVWRRSK